MMNTRDLDSILADSAAAPPGEDSTISVAGRISAEGDTVLAEVIRTDVLSGRGLTELVRFRAGGLRSASLTLMQAPDAAERRIAAALSGAHGTGLLAGPGGVWALRDEMQPLADAVNALDMGPIARVVTGGGWCAVMGQPGQDNKAALQVFRVGAAPLQLETDALRQGGWRHLSALAIMGETLFASVADPVSGFDLYRCDLAAGAPAFEPVITRGAYRFALNGAISAMCETAQGLLIGTAALAGPAQPVGNWGPELLLVTPEGKWDLVAGQPRFSPAGLLLPASTQMPGMGDARNAAVKAIAHHAGRTVIALQVFSGDPVEDRRDAGCDLFDYRGAVRLYISDDLDDWQELAHDLPEDTGAVTGLCLTEYGVFVGHESLGLDSLPVSFVPMG